MRLIPLGLILAAVTLAPAAYAWPTGKPDGYFPLAAKGEPTLLCAQWATPTTAVLNCRLLAGAWLSWPPANAKPAKTWTMKLKSGAKVTCRQWNGVQRGKYVGLVAACAPAPGSVA